MDEERGKERLRSPWRGEHGASRFGAPEKKPDQRAQSKRFARPQPRPARSSCVSEPARKCGRSLGGHEDGIVERGLSMIW